MSRMSAKKSTWFEGHIPVAELFHLEDWSGDALVFPVAKDAEGEPCRIPGWVAFLLANSAASEIVPIPDEMYDEKNATIPSSAPLKPISSDPEEQPNYLAFDRQEAASDNGEAPSKDVRVRQQIDRDSLRKMVMQGDFGENPNFLDGFPTTSLSDMRVCDVVLIRGSVVVPALERKIVKCQID